MANDSPLVAVVDDEAPVRTMLRRALRLAGYQVATFASGEELLHSLGQSRPACMVVDVHMQGLAGLDVQQRLRSQDMAVPLILITASDDPGLDALAAAAGAICLLRKPFSTDSLLAAVRCALGDSPRSPPRTEAVAPT